MENEMCYAINEDVHSHGTITQHSLLAHTLHHIQTYVFVQSHFHFCFST